MRDSTGLVSNVLGLASDGLRMLRTRLELVAIEVQEEKAHAVRQIVVASVALYLLTFGTLLAILAIAMAIPPDSRETFFAILAVIFLGLGGAGIAWLASFTRRRTMFSETLSVLSRDEQALRGTGD
jgi:uncharacterized membrane protein YqjE